MLMAEVNKSNEERVPKEVRYKIPDLPSLASKVPLDNNVSKRPKRKLLNLFFIALPLLIVIGLLIALLFKVNSPAPGHNLNDAIKKSTSVLSFQPLYYRPLVAKIGGNDGYVYKDKSMVIDANLLSWQFINDAKQTIEVTMQAKPSDLDVESYPGRITLNVATGRAIIGTNTATTSAAIFGDKTMLFVKAKYLVDDDTLRAMLAAFTLN